MDDHRDESENIAVWDFCLLVCLRNGTSPYPGVGREERNRYLNRGGVQASRGRHAGAITNLPSEKHLAEYLHLVLSSKYSKQQWVCLPISPRHTCLRLPGRLSGFHPSCRCRPSNLWCVLGCCPTLRPLSQLVWPEELLTKNMLGHCRCCQC